MLKGVKQFNYHINVSDNNGFISEGNTYFPWKLEEAVEKIKENASLPENEDSINYHRMNEVVFHDAVPMKYLCIDILNKGNKILPENYIENDVKPNMLLLPFYCFVQPEENNRLTSSPEFFKKIANFCNVDENLPKEEIIKKIQKKMQFLNSHRYKQNIKVLKNIYDDYIYSHYFHKKLKADSKNKKTKKKKCNLNKKSKKSKKNKKNKINKINK
jgi:hypothetical protein